MWTIDLILGTITMGVIDRIATQNPVVWSLLETFRPQIEQTLLPATGRERKRKVAGKVSSRTRKPVRVKAKDFVTITRIEDQNAKPEIVEAEWVD